MVFSGSVEDSAEKVEGPGSRDATRTESVVQQVNNGNNDDVDSRVDEQSEQPPPTADVAATLSGLLAGLPTLAGGSGQRLASSLRQKFVNNSGEFFLFYYDLTLARLTACFISFTSLSDCVKQPTRLNFIPCYNHLADLLTANDK